METSATVFLLMTDRGSDLPKVRVRLEVWFFGSRGKENLNAVAEKRIVQELNRKLILLSSFSDLPSLIRNLLPDHGAQEMLDLTIREKRIDESEVFEKNNNNNRSFLLRRKGEGINLAPALNTKEEEESD